MSLAGARLMPYGPWNNGVYFSGGTEFDLSCPVGRTLAASAHGSVTPDGNPGDPLGPCGIAQGAAMESVPE